MSEQEMKRAIEEHQRYTSMEFFEPKRLEIAKRISDGLGIPLREFVGGDDDTAFFHWLTSLLAIEDWLRKTIFDSQDLDGRGEDWEIARNKLATGAVLRLFAHPFALSFDDQSIQFVDAFSRHTSAHGHLLNALLNGWEFTRELTGSLAQHWWDEGAIPAVSHGAFDPLDQVIEQGGDDMGFLRDVYRDTFMQIATEFDLLLKIQAAGHIGQAFPDELPEDAGRDGIIDTMRRFISHLTVPDADRTILIQELG